jgi:signal transduction histidine kinase
VKGSWVAISVQDSGAGIPEEELSRIFERFYQLDKSRKGGPDHGAGLGLAIANQIVQAHQGEISAESVLGEGCVFVVRLPIANREDESRVSRY